MLRDRISEDVYALISDLYYEVTAGFVTTPQGAVVIDTLAFPSEAKQLKKAVLKECPKGVKYVILTHYHADHTLGSYIFDGAEIIASEKTRTLLRKEGAKKLSQAKAENPELEEAQIILPDVTFAGEMSLHIGDRNLRLIEMPGHSPDAIVVYIQEEKILFTGDLMMPLPYVADGDVDTLIASLERLKEFNLEHIVQGHGGVLLKGEIPEALEMNINYLKTLKAKVAEAIEKGHSLEDILKISVEECGKSRIVMGALTEYVHRANLAAVYEALTA